MLRLKVSKMKTWSECCNEVGYSREEYKDAPKVRMNYFGYKNGQATQFETIQEARNYSSLVESVKNPIDVLSHEVFWDTLWDKLRQKECNAAEVWEAALKEDFDYLSSKVYSLCYNQAYERGRTDGYDEVYNYMCDVVDFAQEILATVK